MFVMVTSPRPVWSFVVAFAIKCPAIQGHFVIHCSTFKLKSKHRPYRAAFIKCQHFLPASGALLGRYWPYIIKSALWAPQPTWKMLNKLMSERKLLHNTMFVKVHCSTKVSQCIPSNQQLLCIFGETRLQCSHTSTCVLAVIGPSEPRGLLCRLLCHHNAVLHI